MSTVPPPSFLPLKRGSMRFVIARYPFEFTKLEVETAMKARSPKRSSENR